MSRNVFEMSTLVKMCDNILIHENTLYDECSICYESFKNKAFVNECLHPFCYECIIVWSQVKAVCPLCIQPMNGILHNIRSLDDYDVQEVVPPKHDVLAVHDYDIDYYPVDSDSEHSNEDMESMDLEESDFSDPDDSIGSLDFLQEDMIEFLAENLQDNNVILDNDSENSFSNNYEEDEEDNEENQNENTNNYFSASENENDCDCDTDNNDDCDDIYNNIEEYSYDDDDYNDSNSELENHVESCDFSFSENDENDISETNSSVKCTTEDDYDELENDVTDPYEDDDEDVISFEVYSNGDTDQEYIFSLW